MPIHTDLSKVPVSVAPSPATSGTTVGVTDANAAFLPNVYPWWGVFVPTGSSPTRSNAEVVLVTAGSSAAGTTTYTIQRAKGAPATTAQTVTTGFDLYESIGAGYIEYINNLPQGTMFNGKISVTVASSNITVAIKTLAGNDPSASEPVWIRIGDTVRVITAALSVTKNAGTNWFGVGSTGLATIEQDYFAYLGYNATDGVVIGFARVPFGTRYDSFSATTTNDNYCAISTITTAAAGDYYEVIGRFAATLSATASFNWSVPTFTALNLIQRPILETRWLSWTPAYGSNGSMTYTSVTGTTIYKLDGDTCYFTILAAGTTGSTTTTGISATLPFTSFALDQPGASSYYDAGGGAGFFTINTPWNIIYMYKQAEANWGIGTNRQVKSANYYRIK